MHEVVAPDMVLPLRSEPHELPSLSQRRPRLGCFFGTFRPSRFQIRSTRLWFTRQPSRRSSAVIRRYPYRPKAEASSTIRLVSGFSSSRSIGAYRCVDLGCLKILHARLSDTRYRPRKRVHRLACLPRAQKFPEAMSCSICLSSDSSATSFLSRAFSFSSSLNRFAWSVFRPAVLAAPLVVRLISDADLPAHLLDREPLRQVHLRLTQLVDDLLRRMPFPSHA
jgi:hypothetical protein